ncbi:MAG: NAD(P)/FAD-dependent oxidoreductase [Magnetovibrionaceae bacterium]
MPDTSIPPAAPTAPAPSQPEGPDANPTAKRFAVIGSGIGGMSAAWALAQCHAVDLLEKDDRIGGHSHTQDVEVADGPRSENGIGSVPVDTGFIVYNEKNYPNLVALFEHLGVPTKPSDMSFAASLDDGGLEYSGTDMNGLFGQRINILRPRFWRMIRGILRFYKEAPERLATGELDTITLGQLLDDGGYHDSFVRDHLLPMGAAIWSTPSEEMRDYPAAAFVRFFESHGLLKVDDRPQWRTVDGGSREYVKRITDHPNLTLRRGVAVAQVQRLGNGKVSVIQESGQSDIYDGVVIAAHADQALALLADPLSQEAELLSAFAYTKNIAYLHSDPHLMPKRRRVWSSWNYLNRESAENQGTVFVSYWMNLLQGLETKRDIFVTLNPDVAPREELTHSVMTYTHPLFSKAAIAAQKRLWSIQGQGNVWFAGSYFGHGFHEDALQSGLAAAEGLGGVRRPWTVEDESGRIHLQPVEADSPTETAVAAE